MDCKPQSASTKHGHQVEHVTTCVGRYNYRAEKCVKRMGEKGGGGMSKLPYVLEEHCLGVHRHCPEAVVRERPPALVDLTSQHDIGMCVCVCVYGCVFGRSTVAWPRKGTVGNWNRRAAKRWTHSPPPPNTLKPASSTTPEPPIPIPRSPVTRVSRQAGLDPPPHTTTPPRRLWHLQRLHTLAWGDFSYYNYTGYRTLGASSETVAWLRPR